MKPKVSTYVFPQTEELMPELEELGTDGAGEIEPQTEESQEIPQSPIDYAKVQADLILEDAKRRSEELLAQARDSMEEELEQLRQAAREEGYHQGYGEGMAGAIAETKAQREAQAVQMQRELRDYLEKASLAQAELIDQVQDELRDLSIAIAEKVVQISLKSSGEIVGRMIRAATEKLKRREWVHIYIAGCDAKGMAQVAPSLTVALSALSEHVKILPMADDESGTCIIEMPDEIIDASASTQLSNIREILAERSGGEIWSGRAWP